MAALCTHHSQIELLRFRDDLFHDRSIWKWLKSDCRHSHILSDKQCQPMYQVWSRHLLSALQSFNFRTFFINLRATECGRCMQNAYLLKSRMRRRRAGVDILIEHYLLAKQPNKLKEKAWLKMVPHSDVWFSTFTRFQNGRFIGNALKSFCYDCMCVYFFTNNTVEIISPCRCLLLQRITINPNQWILIPPLDLKQQWYRTYNTLCTSLFT